MVKCYLISTPRKNQRTIFEKGLWGFEDKYEDVWRKLLGEYTLFLERKDNEYWIIGGGIVRKVYKDENPNPDWGETRERSKYPLRIEFERVFRISPVHSRDYFEISHSFTVLEAELPSELEKYFVGDRAVFNRLTRISEAIAFRELAMPSEEVALIPPLLLKPILSGVSSEEFEDICCIALKLLGLKVEHLGYKRRYEDVWDLEIKGRVKPVIIDVKNSESYSLTVNERRKLKDYVEKKSKEDKAPDMILIALGFDNTGIDSLKELKSELEGVGIAWFYAVKYYDIISLLPKKAKDAINDPLENLKECSVI